MRHVPYIEKTHDYYVRKGYENPYRYAHFASGPFAPVTKPVRASRLILISSAGFQEFPEGAPAPVPFKGINIGDKDEAEVFPIPSGTPKERLRYITGAHNRADSPMADVDSFFPVTRLRELAAEGVIGSLARDFLRIRPCYSTRKTEELDAPEVLRRCREQAVDVALLAPV